MNNKKLLFFHYNDMAHAMINTINESSLHKTLKEIYSLNNDLKTEVEKDGYIYDILDENRGVIEIQTQNIEKLLPKIKKSIMQNRKIKIIYPLPAIKYIELYSKDGVKISRRKSPKKCCIYNIFNDFRGVYSVLLESLVSIEVLLIEMTEVRIQTEMPVQSKNNKRRFCKNWLKKDKKLDKIISKRIFNSAKDYLNLLPKEILPEFSAKSISIVLKKDEKLPAIAASYSNIMIWLLVKMNLIKYTRTINRSKFYQIKGNEDK